MNRIEEVDFFRGIALILMIIFHIFFDLEEFFNYDIVKESIFINLLGKTSSTLFIIIAGISSHLSRNNKKRSLLIFLYASIISFITYLYSPISFIGFGILHFLAFSIFFADYFKKLSAPKLIFLSCIIISLGIYFKKIIMPNNILFPLGLVSAQYSSLDFFPIFPNLGIFFIGLAVGKIFYKQKKPRLFKDFPIKSINFLGRHSLFIYLIHQPLILAFLFLLFKIAY